MKHRPAKITSRDIDILGDLFGHGVLSASELLGLGHFRSQVRCRARLRRLMDTGLVCTVNALPVQSSRNLYRAATACAPLIASSLGLDECEIRRLLSKPCTPFLLEHSCRIAEFRVWLQRTHRQIEWLCEAQARHVYSVPRAGAWQRRILKPDGFFRLSGGACFFVEIDLGHVSRPKFKAKIGSYRLYAGGVFQDTYGEAAFTVLVVTTGALRLRHLSVLVSKADPRFLFTTFQQLESAGAHDAIWLDPLQKESHSLEGLPEVRE